MSVITQYRIITVPIIEEPLTNLTEGVDLVVTDFVAPTNAESDNEINLSWTVANQGTETTTAFSWYDRVYLSADTIYDNSDLYVWESSHFYGLAPDDTYDVNVTAFLPNSPTAGDYYLLVVTDVIDLQAEIDEGNNVKAMPISVTKPNVDLVVTDFVAPSSAKSGDEINLSWTVKNQGTEAAAAIYWADLVVLSTDTVYNDGDLLVQGSSNFQGLAPDGTYNVDVTAFLPNPPTAGDYYLLVVADFNDNQAETDEGNNVKAIPITVTLPDVDLVVSSVTVPSTVEAGQTYELSWTVTNQGTEATTSFWYDGVYLSTDDIFDDSDLYIADSTKDTLEPGQSYTIPFSEVFNNVPTVGDYYLLFVTDVDNYEVEADETNNVKAVPITVTAPAIDLVVTSFIAPSTAVIGVPFNISWTVTNQGTEATTIPSWQDIAYYSFDDIFGGDIYLTQESIGDTQGLPLAPGESYSFNASVELSDSLGAGDYYLFVEADSLNYQPETDNTNNIASAVITGTKSPVDLELTSINAPSSAKPGDEIELSWIVTNIGTEVTDASSWFDNVFLYTGNDTVSPGELIVSAPITDVLGLPLDPGESYTVNTTVKLPDTITPGPYYFDSYYLRFYIDYGDGQAESSSFNNSNYLPIAIPITPPNVDLVVTSATAPSTISSGEPIELSWTVTNQGTVITTYPYWSDGVYLSTDETFDFSDSFVTNVYTGDYQPLESGESYTTSNPYSTSIIAEAGNYYLLFVSDVNNEQLETDEDNNVKAIPITVTTPDVDLVTSNVSTPVTAEAGEIIDISWTVTNQGTEATTVPYWFDYVLLSTDTVFDFIFSPNPDIAITGYNPEAKLPLAPGEGYTVNQGVTIPNVAPGQYYLLFGNNAYNFQPDTNPENDVVVVPFTVTEEPDGVDLFVSSASAPNTAGAGKEIDLSWTVTNEGTEATTAPDWYDYVFLSTDTTVDFSSSPNPDITITFEQPSEVTGQLPLGAGGSYTINQTGTIPDSVAAGDYYLLFVSDINNSQDETNQNNNVLVVPFTVLSVDDSVDLVTSDVAAPTVATAGSTFLLSWTVTNEGTSATDATYWYDYALFSTDTVVDFLTFDDDIALTLKNPEAELPLAPGEGYTIDQNGTIPNATPGLYYLLFVNDIYDSQEDIDPGNDVVVVPFSVVQYTMTGSTSSESLTGTDESESIEALEGRDEILANGGADVIVGGTGGDTITGGAGADRLIYRILQDMGDTITDFTVNEDKIDISELLDSFSYQGSNPVTDGYLRSFQGANGTSVQVDADGSIGRGIFRPFIFLENVAANDLTLSDFLV